MSAKTHACYLDQGKAVYIDKERRKEWLEAPISADGYVFRDVPHCPRGGWQLRAWLLGFVGAAKEAREARSSAAAGPST